MRWFRNVVLRNVRGVLALLGVFLASYGVLQLRTVGVHYENWWGGLVFAPFTIVAGVFVMYVALFHTDRFTGRQRKARRR